MRARDHGQQRIPYRAWTDLIRRPTQQSPFRDQAGGATSIQVDGVGRTEKAIPCSEVSQERTWYFTVASYTDNGVESAPTGAMSKRIG